MVQEKILGQGPQDNESAIEQAKDEQMSDFIRGQVCWPHDSRAPGWWLMFVQYKSASGKDFPVADK